MRRLAERYLTCLIFAFELGLLIALSEMVRLLFVNSSTSDLLLNVALIWIWLFGFIPLSLLGLWLLNANGVRKLVLSFGPTEQIPLEMEKAPELPKETEKLPEEMKEKPIEQIKENPPEETSPEVAKEKPSEETKEKPTELIEEKPAEELKEEEPEEDEAEKLKREFRNRTI